MRLGRLLVVLGAALPATPALAQEDPPSFPRVYQYDQPLAGWAEFNAWTTYVASSDQRYQHFDQDVRRQGLVAHSFEAEFGVTDRVTLGGYLDFDDARSGPLRFTEGRIVARYRFSNRQDLFVNPGLYVEYYFPRAGYGDQELETRIILDKGLNDFRIAANPRFSVTTQGDNRGDVNASLDAGVYYRRSGKVQPGLEYHAEFGKIGDWRDEKHYLEPTLDIGLGKQLNWHLAAGIGLNGHSDKFIVQSILTLELNAIRPSRLFGRNR